MSLRLNWGHCPAYHEIVEQNRIANEHPTHLGNTDPLEKEAAMANYYGKGRTNFTVTETMTVTFVLDWGVIQVPVTAPEDGDGWSDIVSAADDVLTDYLVDRTSAYEQASEVYLTNAYDETVEV